MPLTSFTIAGNEVDPLLETFEIRETSGAVSTMVCDVASIGSPVQLFDLHDPVIVEEDGVTIFAGTVTQTRVSGFGGPNIYDATDAPQIVTSITAEDWFRLADRVYLTVTVAAGTLLKAFLTTVVAGDLGDLGVTLHPSQVNGPALPEMTFTRVRVSDVLTALTDATGYVSRIDYGKNLRMWAPGDLAAPFNIDEDDDPSRWTGDVEVESVLGDNYANRVTVVSDPIEVEGHIEYFTGDGTTATFPLEYTLLTHTGFVNVDGVDQTLSTAGIGFDLAAYWLYYPATNSIRSVVQVADVAIDNPPPLGAAIAIVFKGVFQGEATAEDAGAIAAFGLYAYVEQRKDITTTAAAQAMADALLAERLNAGEHIVLYETRYTAPTLRAGQQLTLTAPARDVSGSHLITDMRVRAETPVTSAYTSAGLGLIRSITAKRNQLGDKWQGTYHDWLQVGGGGGVGVEVGPGGPSSSGAAPPDTAVQFNDAGRFGAKETYTFNKLTNDIVIGGGGSDITATSTESCGVEGYDCHITD